VVTLQAADGTEQASAEHHEEEPYLPQNILCEIVGHWKQSPLWIVHLKSFAASFGKLIIGKNRTMTLRAISMGFCNRLIWFKILSLIASLCR
jgi:hypothetical protein